tara:strand:+ start:544 stop:2433 length:1890 start_codon:yes stop_codon:yes gene_type:complete
MANGVNTGGFVPTQPAIVDTSASFTRLLNIAQRQQERETAMQLAEQQRRQKQMEAQLDIINGFDSSKMVADDRAMFNDAVNQLRMDFVEGRITDPMQFRGRVGKLRNYYGQFTQYAQNPETLAMRDNMMKVSYYPSELNKANEELGPGRRYVTDEAIYNDRVNRFEHPLAGRQYEITPDGTILAKTEQGLVPVDALPREGASLFQIPDEFNAEGLTIEAIAAPLRTGMAQVRNVSNYIGMTYESNLMGTQDGRASMVGDFTDNRGGFGAFDELVEAHITGARSAVKSLIAGQEENRGKEMSRVYDEFLNYSNQEWDKAMRAMLPKLSTSATQTELGRKRAALLQGGEYLPRTPFMNTVMPESSYTVGILGGESMPLEGGEKGAGDEFFDVVVDPVDIVFFDDGRVGMKYTVKDRDGTIDARYIDRSQRPRLSRYLQGEFGITLDELESAYRRKFPATQSATQTAAVTDQPEQQFVIPVFFPEDTVQQPIVTPEPVVAPDTVDVGMSVTASPGQSPGEYEVQTRNVENRREAIENPESLKLKVREDYNINPLLTRTMEDSEFRDNLQNLLDDTSFQRALVESGYVDFRGLIGDVSGERRNKAMIAALEDMGNDDRAIYVKQFIQSNKDRF